MTDNDSTDERNGVSRANERAIRAIVRDELRGGERDERDGGVTRREVLEAAGLVGLGTLGGGAAMNGMVGTAEAATGTGNLGTTSNPLDTLYANNVGDSTEPVQAINTGQITLNGDTKTAWPSGGGDVSVSDSGTQVVAAASDLNFAAPFTVADDSDGTVTLDVNLDMGTL